MTRKGLFRYTRLLFGINCAPEYFQKSMEQILSGCEGCLIYIDDVIVYGSDREEHDLRLQEVLAYASKSLSDTERRYAQIEKEALALVWAVERFHYYLYGRKFELITDHKPLETIFGSRSKPCARIERWVVRLQAYKGTVIYKPGKSNIADPRSRLAITANATGMTFDDCAEHYVQWVASNAKPVALKLTEIEQASKTDSAIQAVRVALDEGVWAEEALPYKLIAVELCFAGSILLRGTRIVIPEQLRT